MQITAYQIFAVMACGLAWHQSNAAHAETETFTLVERLGHDWMKERVRFPVSSAFVSQAGRGMALVNERDQATPFEIIDRKEGPVIEFSADLPKFGSSSYRLKGGMPPAASDLVVEEHSDQIRIVDAGGGVAVRTRLAGQDAPIAALRLPNGNWVGASQFVLNNDKVVSYSARVERRGPVAATIVCLTQFASGAVWELRLTMEHGSPALLVDEQWDRWSHPEMRIRFGPEVPLSQIYYRTGSGQNIGKVAAGRLRPAQGDIAFRLEPWLHWWIEERRGNWFAAYADTQPYAVILGATQADDWISPADHAQGRTIEPIVLTATNNDLDLVLPERGAKRHWAFAAVPPADAVDPALIGKQIAPPAQKLVIRYGDFPLDRVKDLVLSWGPNGLGSHRLLLTDQDIKRLRSLGNSNPDDRRRLAATPIGYDTLHDIFDYYLRTGDPDLGKRISAAALQTMQRAVDLFLDQSQLVTMGYAPHHQKDILVAVHLTDFALADGYLSEAEREQLRAQAAFLSYLVRRADYWDPKRGFSANPNMTSIVAGYQGMLACLLADHPLAELWLNEAITELFDNELFGWSDDNGGWLEAPSYAMLSYDHMLGVFACARNMGRSDYLFHPRMKKVISWLAKISTPPDSRIGGHRHHPPIGNTYMLEPSGEFGTVAYLWRERDPYFSAEMQWMHQQQGSPISMCVGGYGPSLGPYQKIFKDPLLPAARPDYTSELFPNTGAILRNHFGTARETQLHLIAGSNHDHYDDDSGSITLWGKGRLIADDFGYYGRAPASDHSMVESKTTAATMQVTAFSSQDTLDVVQARRGGWTRQIAMLKDSDPLGPNAYVIRDEISSGQAGTWRLWFNADRIELSSGRAKVVGRDDVDTDVIFLTGQPESVKLETRTRTSSSSFFNKPYATTQTGLIVALPGNRASIAVLLYPRLRSDSPPEVHTAMNSRVVLIKDRFASQTLFLATEPFRYDDERIAFHGTAGLLKIARDGQTATLGAKGSISALGQTLVAAEPRTTRW